MTLRALLGEAADIYPTLPEDGYTLIVSDGAYGIGGFPGDPKSPKALADWYAPHLDAWDRLAAPSSSLYFWCTPEGCARMLPHVEAAGWSLYSCIRWDKGTSQMASMNYGTVRGWVNSSEDCYFYVRESDAAAEWAGDGYTHRSVPEVAGASPENTVRDFIRSEWRERAGLGNREIVEAWNTTAEHFTRRGSQWVFPSWQAFERLAFAAWRHSEHLQGLRPPLVLPSVWDGDRYDHDDDIAPARLMFQVRDSWTELERQWRALLATYEARRHEYEALRYPFTLPPGVTDVWTGAPVSRPGRHGCAKRDDHIERIVKASSRPGDRVLEPFGGGAPVLRACRKFGRSCDSIERDPEWHRRALAGIDTAAALAVPDPKALPGQGGLFG